MVSRLARRLHAGRGGAGREERPHPLWPRPRRTPAPLRPTVRLGPASPAPTRREGTPATAVGLGPAAPVRREERERRPWPCDWAGSLPLSLRHGDAETRSGGTPAAGMPSPALLRATSVGLFRNAIPRAREGNAQRLARWGTSQTRGSGQPMRLLTQRQALAFVPGGQDVRLAPRRSGFTKYQVLVALRPELGQAQSRFQVGGREAGQH